MRLPNKVALITSAQHPCAQAIVLGFAREGANCVIVDDDGARAEALAADVRTSGRRALALTADVTDKAAVAEVVRRTVAEFGRIDILLNCSAVEHASDFLSFSEADFYRCLNRGPKAYFLFSQAVGRVMSEQRAGKIINLSTTDGRIGSGESTGNSAAASSIESLTRAIAQAMGFYGVNCNAIVAGPLNSFTGTPEEVGERMRRIPLGRLAKPEDMVGAALLLAGDDANYISGECICIDAGYHNAAVTEDGFRPAWGKVWGTFEIPPHNK